MLDESWEILFDQVFDSTYNNLLYKKNKLQKTLGDIEAELEHLYIYQGHCGDGRSESKETEIEASVQAYQLFIRKEFTNHLST